MVFNCLKKVREALAKQREIKLAQANNREPAKPKEITVVAGKRARQRSSSAEIGTSNDRFETVADYKRTDD